MLVKVSANCADDQQAVEEESVSATSLHAAPAAPAVAIIPLTVTLRFETAVPSLVAAWRLDPKADDVKEVDIAFQRTLSEVVHFMDGVSELFPHVPLPRWAVRDEKSFMTELGGAAHGDLLVALTVPSLAHTQLWPQWRRQTLACAIVSFLKYICAVDEIVHSRWMQLFVNKYSLPLRSVSSPPPPFWSHRPHQHMGGRVDTDDSGDGGEQGAAAQELVPNEGRSRFVRAHNLEAALHPVTTLRHSEAHPVANANSTQDTQRNVLNDAMTKLMRLSSSLRVLITELTSVRSRCLKELAERAARCSIVRRWLSRAQRDPAAAVARFGGAAAAAMASAFSMRPSAGAKPERPRYPMVASEMAFVVAKENSTAHTHRAHLRRGDRVCAASPSSGSVVCGFQGTVVGVSAAPHATTIVSWDSDVGGGRDSNLIMSLAPPQSREPVLPGDPLGSPHQPRDDDNSCILALLLRIADSPEVASTMSVCRTSQLFVDGVGSDATLSSLVQAAQAVDFIIWPPVSDRTGGTCAGQHLWAKPLGTMLSDGAHVVAGLSCEIAVAQSVTSVAQRWLTLHRTAVAARRALQLNPALPEAVANSVKCLESELLHMDADFQSVWACFCSARAMANSAIATHFAACAASWEGIEVEVSTV